MTNYYFQIEDLHKTLKAILHELQNINEKLESEDDQ